MAAFGLEAMQALTGGAPREVGYFPYVYAMIAGLSLLSVISFARMSPTAGGELLVKKAARA